ncbi:DUF2225 domain-containing protein [Geosporobacter ferrireducens]|uniref:DUF2225 domain-containing protein n=1 Tax=Geosporobacter ferrireducens TaxID=1424294 RepID=A0A1D8GN77_9FIRM|nr:DUF2225 domain-containing protein [Geosporobacter ferrireducens]AOT72370.1 hypothetical protein Gferi_24165 [Geosporobacter ferrireducens]MTI56374.1 DUF2225 domain-containing protein [Geosporobacter ferrireducens]
MNQDLFDREIQCPVCKNIFHTKRVKSSACRIEKRDTDFCVVYSSTNPMFYGAHVCPMCGYAAMESVFKDITPQGKKVIETAITKRWVQRSFGEERSVYDAIEAHKLALICGQVLNHKKGALGNICLKLAWFHRFINNEREREFLHHAQTCFEEAFLHESLPIGNLDEVSLTYLIGELNRRLGKYEESIDWFNKAVENPLIKRNKKLEAQAREQWRLAKEEFKKLKNDVRVV